MKKRLHVLLALIFVATIALLLLGFRNPSQGTVAFEVAKALLQLGVVAVAGTLVSVAMKEYELDQTRKENDRDVSI
ncbi:MAG: hypothetical protein ABJB61_03645 [bacterium]